MYDRCSGDTTTPPPAADHHLVFGEEIKSKMRLM